MKYNHGGSIIQDPITGKENQGDLLQPFQALVQFYCAFNSGDINMMSQNWYQSDEIAMDNPLGGVKRGWNEIKEVYEKIFNGPAEVYVEYYDYTFHETNEIFYSRDAEYLIHTKNKTPVGARNLSLAWAEAIEIAEIADLRFHDLRHDFASRLVMAGSGIEAAKVLLRQPMQISRSEFAGTFSIGRLEGVCYNKYT